MSPSQGASQIRPALLRDLAHCAPVPGPLAVCGRTHASAPIKVRRTIHKFDSANSVCSCAVFLASPR